MKIAYIDMQNIKLGIRELGRDRDRKKFFVLKQVSGEKAVINIEDLSHKIQKSD